MNVIRSVRIVLVALAALGAAVLPALAFEGLVVDDRTGQPIAHAEVAITGRPGSIYTDSDGRFVWKPTPPPPFEILVVLPGERYTKPVLIERLPDAGPLEVRVSMLVEELVTVMAGAAPDIEATPGAATTLLSGREVQTRMPANLTQVLENVAGVAQVSEGQAAVPAIRGLARGRTVILLDGARVSTERRVGPSATFLDPFVLDGVEVARGPGSVAYGSDAFGGVILARTRRVAPGSPLEVRASTTLGVGLPEQRAALAISGSLGRRTSVLAEAHYRNFDDYDSPRGEVFNSSARDKGFLFRTTHQLPNGELSVSWQSDFGGDIDRPRTNSRTVRFFYPTEDSHRFTVNYGATNVGGFARVDLTGLLGAYHVVTDQARFATATRGRSLERADVDARDFQVRASAERLFGQARLTVGSDVSGRFGLRALDITEQYSTAGALTSRAENVSVDRARRADAGVFATIEVAPVSTLILAGGVRGDRVSTRNRGGYFGDASTSNGSASGFASATLDLSHGFSLTGQVARGFRDPVLSDRYYRGPTGRGFITGNPDLDPETSLQFDGGLRYTSAKLRLGAYAFHYRIDDLVERYETTTDFFFFRNRGRARIRGVEVEAQAQLAPSTSLEIAGHIQRGTALDNGAALDDIAPDTLTLLLRHQFSSRLSAHVRGAFFATDDRPGPTEQARPAYAVADAVVTFRFNDQLELRGSARNLLDAAYLVSPDSRAVYAPGRSASLTVATRF